MSFLIIELIIWVVLAAVIGFLAGWLLRIWPFWKRFRDYEKSFENYLLSIDSKIRQTESEYNDQLKIFQIKYEERMRKFQTEYEEGLNNFQNDYADGFSGITKETKILAKEIELFKKEIEHKLSEYSSRYFYLENRFNSGFTNSAYEAMMDELAKRIDAVDKRIVTHKHDDKPSPKAKTAVKKKSTARTKKTEKDNLQLIAGIGEALEGILNKQKVYTFKQLAEMSKDDIELISKKVKGFGDKVKKYKWVNQAKSLYKKTSKK